jgi:N-acyl-D-amino-acid deacylase
MIGHTPLRRYVVGDDALERASTDDEIRTMRRLVGEALDAGAFGFATSKSRMHRGDGGRPVPSRLATVDEIAEIVAELGLRRQGIAAVAFGQELFISELAALSKASGRPVTWTALVGGMSGMDPVAVLEEARGLGGEVWPQIACRPVVMQVTLTDPMPFGVVRAFQEILAAPPEGRGALYADPAWRERARRDFAASVWGTRWNLISVQETARHASLRDGPSLAEIAADRQADPLDVMVDLALEDDLTTRFRVVLGNEDESQVASLLQQPDTLLGLSDAGAHASQLCDACYSTHLLGYWVREQGCLSLEQAVWRLTGHPAEVFRVRGRGRIAPGYAADLVAFDPDRVGVEGLERVWDLPAGADRLIARSRGVHSMWVNGERTRADGTEIDGVRPGRLLRAVADG